MDRDRHPSRDEDLDQPIPGDDDDEITETGDVFGYANDAASLEVRRSGVDVVLVVSSEDGTCGVTLSGQAADRLRDWLAWRP